MRETRNDQVFFSSFLFFGYVRVLVLGLGRHLQPEPHPPRCFRFNVY